MTWAEAAASGAAIVVVLLAFVGAGAIYFTVTATPAERGPAPWPSGFPGIERDALIYALEELAHQPAEAVEFLRSWREGYAFAEWPQFYEWLDDREHPAWKIEDCEFLGVADERFGKEGTL